MLPSSPVIDSPLLSAKYMRKSKFRQGTLAAGSNSTVQEGNIITPASGGSTSIQAATPEQHARTPTSDQSLSGLDSGTSKPTQYPVTVEAAVDERKQPSKDECSMATDAPAPVKHSPGPEALIEDEDSDTSIIVPPSSQIHSSPMLDSISSTPSHSPPASRMILDKPAGQGPPVVEEEIRLPSPAVQSVELETTVPLMTLSVLPSGSPEDPDAVFNLGFYDLSPERLALAKDVILDLLGWGVPPEYLLECGVSVEIVTRIFSDLNLSLPESIPNWSKHEPYNPTLGLNGLSST